MLHSDLVAKEDELDETFVSVPVSQEWEYQRQYLHLRTRPRQDICQYSLIKLF